MGDFNNGPTSSQLNWIYPFHHGLITARGFVSPYYLLDGRCTFCADNNIVASYGSSENELVDHIWTTTVAFRKVKYVKVIELKILLSFISSNDMCYIPLVTEAI